MRPVARLRSFLQGWDQALRLGQEAAVRHELEDADDVFMLLCFSEIFGIPNPAAWHTLELYPYLLEQFHEWHKRMGMERSPLERFRCC